MVFKEEAHLLKINRYILGRGFVPRSYWQLNHHSVSPLRGEKMEGKGREGGRKVQDD